MIVPIGHDKGVRRRPYVTLAIIALCLGVHVYRVATAPSERQIEARLAEMTDPDADQVTALIADLRHGDLAWRWGYIPARGFGLNAVRSAFVHAGWLHLVFNMLFLWLAGANMEDRWGRAPFAAFYLAAAAVASVAFGIWNPGAEIPMVGASGAVAGCMGAFLVCYYRTTIRFWYWSFMRTGTFEARALYALPIWFGTELLSSLFEAHGIGGVAHSAHVGGFAFGLAVAAGLRAGGLEERHLLSADEREDDWHAHNPELEEAMAYARNGNASSALALFLRVLAKRPDHALARQEVVRLALDQNEPETARPYLSAAVLDLAHAADHDGVLALWRRLQKPWALHLELTDRALTEVARAALASGEPSAPVAVAVVRQMIERHGTSPLLPGLLWRVAELQDRMGREDLVRRTLELLVTRFPADVFADQARARLARRA